MIFPPLKLYHFLSIGKFLELASWYLEVVLIAFIRFHTTISNCCGVQNGSITFNQEANNETLLTSNIYTSIF